jgi:hypothetical protein
MSSIGIVTTKNDIAWEQLFDKYDILSHINGR